MHYLRYIGIDPGVHGAIAVIDAHGKMVSLYDAPVLMVASKSKKQMEYQIPEMDKILREHAERYAFAALEEMHALPGESIRSSFSIGKGMGIWLSLLTAHSIPYMLVRPSKWKTFMLSGMGRDKDASRFRAQQLFPGADLSLKKHDGRAEALLIAEYTRRSTENTSDGEKTAPTVKVTSVC